MKSTGPKTEQGKRAVRFNAVNHGFFAKQILLSNLEDDPTEFEAQLRQLREDLQPVGQLEELLVERIAVCFWKSRRALRCEIAEAKENSSEAVEEMKKKGKDPYLAEEAIESAKRAREKAERELTKEEKEARVRDIDERIRDLEEDFREVRDDLEVRANSLALPGEKDLDRILRYGPPTSASSTAPSTRLSACSGCGRGSTCWRP